MLINRMLELKNIATLVHEIYRVVGKTKSIFEDFLPFHSFFSYLYIHLMVIIIFRIILRSASF